MLVMCPFGSGKRKTTIFNISTKKRKCMVKMATENEFAGLKLYAFFDLETVDEAPKLYADELRSFNIFAAGAAEKSAADDLGCLSPEAKLPVGQGRAAALP
jgi:hypothetical protein